MGSRLPGLDGVRGLATLLVMISDFTLFGGMKPATHADGLYYWIGNMGWCGVDLFFVLSGFLITGILLDSRTSDHYFRHFYARRCLRIFPLYYGYLALVLVMFPV